MAFSRSTPPQQQMGQTPRTVTTNSGPQTSTTTTGPSSQTQASTGSSSEQSRGSSSSNTTGSRTNESSASQTTVNQNMDAGSLAALQELIQSLASGGTDQQKAKYDQIQSEIAANQQQRENYSKESAFSDATLVANNQSMRALEQLMPTITAGIDAAGTSGSAVASLLTQEAADRAAATAAELSLNTAVQYGQIANQASGVNASLLAIDDPVMTQLLDALNIAKGAQTSQTVTSNSRETERWNESTAGSSSSSSNSTSSQFGAATDSGRSSVQTVGPTSSVQTSDYGIGSGGNRVGGLSTPSSYSAGNRPNPYVNVI